MLDKSDNCKLDDLCWLHTYLYINIEINTY